MSSMAQKGVENISKVHLKINYNATAKKRGPKDK